MAGSKKPSAKTSRKKRATSVTQKTAHHEPKKQFKIPTLQQIGRWFTAPFLWIYKKLKNIRENATHKSFVRTRKRDKIKIPKVEGYIAFSWYVMRVIWNRKWLYFRFVVLFTILSIVVMGSMLTSNIANLNQVIDAANGGENMIGPVTRAIATAASGIGGALSSNVSDVQVFYLSGLFVIALLSMVWLLRQQLAGKRVVVRDGLYNSTAPIAAEYVLIGIGVLQILPLALATLVYMNAYGNGLLNQGIEVAMFTLALVLVIVLTLYFMTTTLFAMLIATIPGTYPLRAYRAARQIVAGQRLRLLVRLFWMVVNILVAWFIVLVPLIIIVNSINLGSSVVIPIAVQTTIAGSIVYGTAYMYLLYRRMIDDPVEGK